MNKGITIIDLLNKKANGEEVPKKIRIDHWYYTFEWVEHDENYYDRHYEIDLMSCLSISAEELNYGVQIIEEDNKEIDRLNNIINELEKELNKKKEAIKTIKDMLGEEAKIVNPHIEVLETEYKYFLEKLKELKENNK